MKGHMLKLKYFPFSQFLLNAHGVAHKHQKREHWELEIWDRSSRSSYKWLVSNTVDDYFQWHIAHKIFKSKIEACPANASFYLGFWVKQSFSFATDLAANFGCNRFRIMPEIVSKHLRIAIWSGCAVRLESEQMLISQTGRRFRSATLHRIWSEHANCSYALIYSETNEWSKRLSKAMSVASSSVTRHSLASTGIQRVPSWSESTVAIRMVTLGTSYPSPCTFLRASSSASSPFPCPPEHAGRSGRLHAYGEL